VGKIQKGVEYWTTPKRMKKIKEKIKSL